MLVRLGRIREAVEFGLQNLLTTDEALTLVRILRSQDEIEESMRVAEQGLILRGDKALLAIWLRDMARDTGDLKRALAAAVIVLRSQPDLDSYLEAKTWPASAGRNTAPKYSTTCVTLIHFGWQARWRSCCTKGSLRTLSP